MKSYSPTRRVILTTALVALLVEMPLFAAQQELATFAAADSVKPWTSVNDGVMGGVSKGGFQRTAQGTLLFSGELSLANNGGFASIRTEERQQDLSDMKAIVVKSRGDGRTYWVELRTSGQMGASSYRADLPTTAGEWQELRIPLADFKLQAFGRALPFKALNPAAVASVGFTLADKKAGPFSLEIESVKADTEASNGIIHVIDQVLIPVPAEAVTPGASGLIELAITRGVPLFNKGEVAACAALYEITCEALLSMAGVTEESRAELATSLKAARAEQSSRQQAWILREGMDRAWTRLKNLNG